MTNRGRPRGLSAPQLEHEIEKCRELEHWAKVEDLAKKLRSNFDSSATQYVTLSHFLRGESKLEQYLLENPPLQNSGNRRSRPPDEEEKQGLREAKSCLLSTIGDEAKQLGVHLDSFILLGKLHFAEANYKDALEYYDRANIDSLEEKQLPTRSLKIMAEAFAIKAICLEKLPMGSTSKAKMTERENAIIRCYEISGDLTMLFLQVADSKLATIKRDKSEAMGQSTWSVASAGTTNTAGSASPVPSDTVENVKTPKERLGPILEAALHQAARLHLKAGRAAKAIARWRSMLMAEECESTKDIRRSVCCQLAQALLHSNSDAKYTKPDPLEFSRRPTGSTRISSESPWRPKRATLSNVFTPKNRHEELILILMLSECIARKDAVLSQDPKFASERRRTHENANMTYDLMALSLARFNQYKILSDMLERSMKFSFKERHSWEQFALSLACEGKHYRALLVFQELVSHVDPKEIDVGLFLSMARLCYDRLGLFTTGLELSQRALESQASNHSKNFSARCNVFVGLGYSLVGRNVENQSERKDLLAKAEYHYKAALALDPNDHLAEFYIALHYAETRRPDQAMEAVKQALALNPDHLSSLHLTILLLSGKKQFEEALELADSVLAEYPDNLAVLSLKVRLNEVVDGGETALNCIKEMIQLWQLAIERMQLDEQMAEANISATAPNALPGTASTPTLTSGNDKTLTAVNTDPGTLGYGTIHSGMRMFDAMSDKDSISLHAHSMTASHIERTLSEVASSLSSHFPPKPGGSIDPTYSLMRIWLLCAEIHLRMGNITEAELCTHEAKILMPMSYHLMHIRGLIHQSKNEFEEARQCFENSLAINPSHVSSLFQLGKVYYQLGFNRLAEHTLKIGVRVDPVSEDLWSLLGLVTEALAQEYLSQGKQPTEPSWSKAGSQSDEAENFSDQEFEDDRDNPTAFQPDLTKVESEFTPTEETVAGFNIEAAKLYEMAAECHSIALSVQSSAPVVPFSTIPLSFE